MTELLSSDAMGYDDPREVRRRTIATEIGLPDTATWDEIGIVNRENERIKGARECGLPETATEEEVLAAQRRFALKRAVAKAGLPDTATWEDVRASEAIALSLPANADWGEIHLAKMEVARVLNARERTGLLPKDTDWSLVYGALKP